MEKNLYKLVLECTYGNKVSLLYLIKKFQPLIKKYSQKLNYDGADSDLIISLIYILKSMPIKTNPHLKEDRRIIGYISKGIRYKYIALSKNLYNSISVLELNEDILENDSQINIEEIILLEDCMDKLPKLQKYIIKEIYFKDKSEYSIGNELNISRQAVNKTKLRALKNLKKYLTKQRFEI